MHARTDRLLTTLVLLLGVVPSPLLGQEAWTLSSRPLVSIGVIDGATEYMLNRVRSVVRLANGNYVVAMANEVRVYDATGRYLSTSGRRGSGPGEFQHIISIVPQAGDTLLVWDSTLRRISVLAPEGEYVRSRHVDLAPFSSERPAFESPLLLSNGFFLANAWNPVMDASANRRGLHSDISIATVLDTIAGSPVVLGEYAGLRRFHSDGNPEFVQPASPLYHEATGGDYLAVGSSDVPRVDVFTVTGRKLITLELGDSPRPLTRRMIDQLRAHALETSSAPPQLIQRAWAEMPMPDHLPHYSALFLDQREHIWIRGPVVLPTDAPPWAIYDIAGRSVAQIVLPVSFVPTWASDTVVAGVWKDELDVEYVRAYRIERRR